MFIRPRNYKKLLQYNTKLEVDEEKPATEEQDTEQNNNADKPAEPQEESLEEQALNDSASNFETAQKLQKRNQGSELCLIQLLLARILVEAFLDTMYSLLSTD